MLRRLKRFLFTGVVLVVMISVGLFAFRSRYNQEIRKLAQIQITNTTSDLINDAIDAQISDGSIQYDRIVFFEKDLNGRITALKTNMSEVNRLKTTILNRINDEILALDTTQLGIPFGNLFLPEFLSGKGPQVPIHILAIRNSDASFSSSFTEAGINQTLQQLTMDICVDIAVLVLGRTEYFSVTSQVVVAETIIVGQVPETFLQTGGYHGNTTENARIDRAAE